MGAAIILAIGNPDPKAIPAFSALGDTIGAWVVTNVEAKPGLLVSAGASVNGIGALKVTGEASDLGNKLAVAMGDPSSDGIKTWTRFATALLKHMETFGGVNGAGFSAPTPNGGPLKGSGLVVFSSMVFVPLLSSQLGVVGEGASLVAAAAMLDLFGAQILTHIAATAQVAPIALGAPFIPFTGPGGGGPIQGAGSIA